MRHLSKVKNTVLQRLVQSDEITKALFYPTPDFLDQPPVEQPHDLVYQKIFPYRYIPDESDEAGTYLTFSLRGYQPVQNTYKAGYLHFNILTQRQLFQTRYDQLRTDLIASEIDRLMNEEAANSIGISKPVFHEMDELVANEHYSGMYIAYKLYEWK
ncbi:hypothetical protein EBB07_06060 [Paenibacillaceae bacterium]|nr:hypothetical protein EBB07_06060 [Paenibacillaceae bacterium]